MYADPDPECADDEWGAGVAVGIPLVVTGAVLGAYVLAYGLDRYVEYADMLGPRGELLQFAVIGGLLIVHGVVHAVAYALLGEGSWRAVSVEVVTDTAGIDPVAVSVLPAGKIRRSAYVVGVAAPGVVLGLLPAAWALLIGNPLAMFVGAVGLLLTGSDVTELLDVLSVPHSAIEREFVSS